MSGILNAFRAPGNGMRENQRPAEPAVLVDWLDGEVLEDQPVSLERVLSSVREGAEVLRRLDVHKLLDAVDAFSESLLTRSNPLLGRYPHSGIPFLGRWCQRQNLHDLLGDSLGSLRGLDGFVPMVHNTDREVRAFPRGTVMHWMAGNVPTLGLLSLISGILTKNANVVRVPTRSDRLLADLIHHLSGLGEEQETMARSVAVIRYDHEERQTAAELSRAADVRIIWGGDESSDAVKRLPAKRTCLDMVFPDRTSFVVLGRSALAPERRDAVTRLIAHDVSVFEQKACASPHTIFLAAEDREEILSFCRAMKRAMSETLKRIPKVVPSQQEVQAVLNLRAQYDMFHEAWYSEGTEYSVFFDDEVQLGPPIGNRTIFVRALPADDDLIALLPPNVQSVGIEAEGEEYERLTNRLGAAGIHRFTPLGAMTHFDIPWDGMSMPQHLVRWTTRQRPQGPNRSA